MQVASEEELSRGRKRGDRTLNEKFNMPEDKRSDDVEKFLSGQKAFEDRKLALIDDLLRQRAEAISVFDERLAKLGYKARSLANRKGATIRRPHRRPQPSRRQRRSGSGAPLFCCAPSRRWSATRW